MMNLTVLDSFKDRYLQNEQGRGVLLAGVVLGMIAMGQASRESEIKSAPLFKQIQFGRMDMKSLKRMLSRVPVLVTAYGDGIKASHLVSALYAEVGRMMLAGNDDLGVDGNFAFSVGFINAQEIFWRIFKKQVNEVKEEE